MPTASSGEDVEVTFDALRQFEYRIPGPSELAKPAVVSPRDALGQVPKDVLALNGRRVVVQGFMAPLRLEEGRVTSFMLCYSRMFCCFGTIPAMNEWIAVDMRAGQSSEYFNDVIVSVSGLMEVGERVEDGAVVSLYRMTADAVKFQSGL